MKSFHRIMAGIILLLAAVILGVNLFLHFLMNGKGGRAYQVEINRLQSEIAENDLEHIDLSKYTYVKGVTRMAKGEDMAEFLEGNGSDYAIKYIEGSYYRFDYEIRMSEEHKVINRAVNSSLGIMAALIIAVLINIRSKLLMPFHDLREVPYELSKGNLEVGLKENKNRYFGRFIWGLDLLREKLEKQKIRELALQKEKKTLVLSISHDIKTPLSAINLYAKALSKNLYNSDEKRTEIAENISAKVNEIEGYVSQIMKASSEDFLSLEVHNKEFYLSEVLEKIEAYYKEKLSLLKIDFSMEPYGNCLLKGDSDRTVEVLQNIMENAIKYGDGTGIRISVSSEEDCRLITVANTGCMLPENELPYIFESFWRGSNTDNVPGSGLGLYICRQLMKLMDGSIYAESQGDEMRVTVVLRMA
ncbi:MAG TPA: HAMP domain-containing sensor histidine kinase [Mobilitalea sp.]|nr:HAMP domain-containing sensor histidine kinase [Mobilitalea sp.]